MTLLRPSAEAAAAPQARRDFGFGLLATLYFGYVFIGLHPLADVSVAARLDGSLLDRLVVVVIFVVALAVLSRRRGAALAALALRPGFVGVSFVIALSVVWSDHPDLTLRRALLYLMLAAAGLAVALAAHDARRLHTALFAALTAVVAVNFIAAAAAPGVAITDIGMRGVYSQKNVAGGVGMAAFILGAFWVAAAPRGRERTLGWLALAAIAAFLWLTRSKTSLALALLAPALGGVIAFAARGRRAALLILAIALGGVVSLLALYAAAGFDSARALDVLIGDSTFTGRDELWAFARRQIALRPWGGYGYGAFWDVGLVDDPIGKLEPGAWLADSGVGTINQAHNGYLDLALNVGVPAAALAAVTLLAALRRALARAHAPGLCARSRAAHASFAALAFALLLHNVTEATLYLRAAPLWALFVVVLFAPD